MNLHDILIDPEKRLSFRQSLDTERLDFPAVLAYTVPPVGEGTILSEAGALMLTGVIRGEMRCVCDRCASEYVKTVEIPLEVPLAAELEDEENPDYFLLDGEELDLADLLETCFILSMDTQFLCREDCKGLCCGCGVNLNFESCRCRQKSDPRLAVLEQLLENKQ